MFIADLHIHSTFSDGKLAIPEIIDLYGARGFGAIAITDAVCESRTVLGKAAVYMNRRLTPAVFPLYMEILKTEALRAWRHYRMIVIPGIEVGKVVGLGVKDFIDASHTTEAACNAIIAQGGVALASSSPFLKSKHISSWKTVFKCERDPKAVLEAIRNQDLAFTYYDEVTNDIFEYVNVRDLGLSHGAHDIRYHFDARSFSLKALRQKRRARSESTRLHLKTLKGRGKRDGRESRELF